MRVALKDPPIAADPYLVSSTLVSAELVPPRRLGEVLGAARHSTGLTVSEVATKSEGAFQRTDILSIEAGLRRLDDEELNTVLSLYEIPRDTVLPHRSRLVLDLNEGSMSVGDIDAPALNTEDEVFERYLALVYTLRGIQPGTPVPLRDVDLDVLGQALRIEQHDVKSRLVTLMEPPPVLLQPRIERLSRQILVPTIGVIVGATTLGMLFMTADRTEFDPSPQGDAPTVDNVAPRSVNDPVQQFPDAELIDPLVVQVEGN